jgi:hypothetical protein
LRQRNKTMHIWKKTHASKMKALFHRIFQTKQAINNIFSCYFLCVSSKLQLHYRASSPLAGRYPLWIKCNWYLISVQSAKGDLPSDSPATLLQFESTFLANVFLQLDVKFCLEKVLGYIYIYIYIYFSLFSHKVFRQCF